ncbi:MAG: LysR family transcriptional regulator [Alcaligenaceae bacterium]|nr:LysR family transcriptional regulator [Alcaligenaceae bacterium]
MDRLACLKVFVEVAQCKSFSMAAQRLFISRPSASKHVARLEEIFGAKLLTRTTKRVGLTEAGHRVLEDGQRLLQAYDELADDMQESNARPRGVVKISAPQSFCTHQLLPLIAKFSQRYPDVQIAMTIDDGRSTFATDGLDIMVRIASAPDDSSHVAIPLLIAPQVLVASPAYIKRAGRPRNIDDLVRHNCMVHTIKSPISYWRFQTSIQEDASSVMVRVHGSIRANFGDVLHHAALLGQGISIHPRYMVARDLEQGRLVELLPDTPPTSLQVLALYSSRVHLPRRVRLLLDYLKDWASTPPDWASRYAG